MRNMSLEESIVAGVESNSPSRVEEAFTIITNLQRSLGLFEIK